MATKRWTRATGWVLLSPEEEAALLAEKEAWAAGASEREAASRRMWRKVNRARQANKAEWVSLGITGLALKTALERFWSPEDVRSMTDAELLKRRGIGPKTLAALRAATGPGR